MQVSLLDPQPLQLPKSFANEAKESVQKQSFGSVLNDALMKVNESQLISDDLTKKMITGEVTDLHQVTIAAEQASLMLNLSVQVRNKVIEAYQEVSRMQI